MNSTLVFLGCLGVLVPQQSPKVSEEPSEAQLLAIITNAYKENYGKVKNLKVREQDEYVNSLSGNPKTKRKSIFYIKNKNIRYELLDTIDHSGSVIIKADEKYTIFYNNEISKMILTSSKDQASVFSFIYRDPSCYGNISKTETIPELLKKLNDRVFKVSKINKKISLINISGLYDSEYAVDINFSLDDNFLCSSSSFVSINKPIRDFKFSIKYESPKGAKFVYPKTLKFDYSRKSVHDETYLEKSNRIYELDAQIDNTITDDLFEIKTPEGFRVIDLTKVASRPPQNQK